MFGKMLVYTMDLGNLCMFSHSTFGVPAVRAKNKQKRKRRY